MAPTAERTALLLCSTTGIGLAAATSLARRGVAVGVCGRSTDGVDAALASLRREGADAAGWSVDVSEPDALDDLFGRFIERFGRLDVLVNNTPPSSSHGPLVGLDLDTWDRDYARLLRPVIQSCQRAIPLMVDVGGGSIVNITSGSVTTPILDHTISTTLRSAVTGLSAVLSGQVGPLGIRVNCVAPYGVVTPTLERRIGRARLESRRRQISVRHLGEPEDMGETVAFLAVAAPYITGVTVPVDGGFVREL